MRVCCVRLPEGDSERSVNSVLQCSDCAALTMESCVGEVFIEQGSPHEWVCTIILSVCRLPSASFCCSSWFSARSCPTSQDALCFRARCCSSRRAGSVSVSACRMEHSLVPLLTSTEPLQSPVKMSACCYFWCGAQREFSISRWLMSRAADGVMTWTSAQQFQNKNH